MKGFREHTNEATGMRLVDLLPKKVKRKIYRIAHADKYKGALAMYRSFKKNSDMQKRGVSDQKMRDIAADHFKLSHREFAKVLNRKTRYEAFKITEAVYDIRPQVVGDINKLNNYSADQKKHIKKLYKHIKSTYHVANPLIFSDDGGPIKIQRELERQFTLSDIKKELEIKLSLKFGTGSAAKVSSMKEFGISNPTEFLEFMQSIGFYLKTDLNVSNFVKTLKGQKIYGDFAIREFINNWDDFVDFCYNDKGLQDDVIMLVNGSYHYKKEIGFKKPYIIWTNISSYYKALKNKEGIIGDVKPNTADCVLIDVTAKELYDALRTDEPIVSDEKTGKLSCDGIEWYQISLKKSKGGAKLGKITKLIKGKYDVGKNADEAGIYFEEYLDEAVFRDAMAKAKQMGKDALGKFKQAAAQAIKFTRGILASIGKLMKREEAAELRFINNLTKRALREGTLNERPGQKEQMDAIVSNKQLGRDYTKHVNKSYKDVKVVNNDVIAMHKALGRPMVSGESIDFLVGNVISFNIINKIVDDVNKNGIKVVNELVRSMAMGDTKLPVVKVYGNASKADYEIISVASLKQGNPKLNKEQVKILLVDIHPKREYFVINLYIFAEIADDHPKYHKISFKKSGAGFTFDIEGAATQRGDKITNFKGLFE